MNRFQLPNGTNNHLKSFKKRSWKRIVFRCRFFINFGWMRELKTISKRGPGCPQVPPGHSWNTSCAPPGPTRLPELDFWWFQLDLGSILEGFGHQNGSQSASKTYKICHLASPALSSSSQTSATPASPVSQWPRRDSRSVNNYYRYSGCKLTTLEPCPPNLCSGINAEAVVNSCSLPRVLL